MSEPTPDPVLSPELIESYRRDGFVVTPDLLTADELDMFGAAVDRAVAERTAGDERTVAEKGTYEQSFVQCMRLWETNRDVAPLTFHRSLAEAASQLLGVERVRLWQDQALYKEAGGRETDPHQDAPFWPIGDAPLVSAWIPFDGSTLVGGTMGYVPGSHRVGALRPVDITHSTEPYDILCDPALADLEATRFVEAPAGSVIWHDGFTVHQALPNRSDSTRRVFTVVFIADGYPRVKPWPVFPLDRDNVAVGDLMQGPGMPLVWPRTGEIPPAPAVIGEPIGPQVRARD